MPSSTAPVPERQLARSQALDDLIMGTNSRSIVSKRSVERLYYPNEPHFFRYFVPKFQRRAPLINRGYWLRLRAIDVIVRQFLLQDKPQKHRVVINLGCGSDVLPWQCHTRYGSDLANTCFVDVDYPDLMKKKRAIVMQTPQLLELLGDNVIVSELDEDPVLLRSEKYCQIACDLRELDSFRKALESFLNLADCSVLFVAEVSVTYMDTKSADALIQWASSIGQAEFCLLEQILPQGKGHPFAQTMLRHFNNMATPPMSVGQYPTLDSQVGRFKSRGWSQVDIWDLWQMWSSDLFVSDAERSALDDIEPFDEWEEFILLGRHYFVVHASATEMTESRCKSEHVTQSLENSMPVDIEAEITSQNTTKDQNRRFGNTMLANNDLGQQFIIHMLGLGNNGRVDTSDIYSLHGDVVPPKLPLNGPTARMCYTLIDLGMLGVLLVGGRNSPGQALSDCWLLERGINYRWQPMPRLPTPLFRHSSVRLGGSSLILVAGGKTGSSHISEDYFVFNPKTGWVRCLVSGDKPEPTFGAILSGSNECSKDMSTFNGVLMGGIGSNGRFVSGKYSWCLELSGSSPVLSFTCLGSSSDQVNALSLFGSSVVNMGSYSVICGGMGQDARFQGQTATILKVRNDGYQVIGSIRPKSSDQTMPFMIGSSAIGVDNTLMVVGGGATCFSMGTYWETSVYMIKIPKSISETVPLPENKQGHSPANVDLAINFVESHRIVSGGGSNSGDFQTLTRGASVATIPRVRLRAPGDFENILRERKPVIIEGLSSGSCLQKWSPEFMAEQVGHETEVVVHECHKDAERMDFNTKNFSYVTEPFGRVMEKVQMGARLYLRALSRDKPSELPAKLENDFPRLAKDFCLPAELDYVKQHMFSSVLRVSGRVNMWLHYDVMANVYTQIVGSKRMILFPPKDVGHLSFAAGASSSSLDVFSALDGPLPALGGTHPLEALLHPGDILLLPALWLHTATSTTDMSVAVNVFFRDLDNGYAVGRDVYGNRDLAAYEKGRQQAARIAKEFQQLPIEAREFYLSRIADELLQTIESGGV